MDNEEKIIAINQQAVYLYQRGRYKEALMLELQSYNLAQKQWGKFDIRTVGHNQNLADIYFALGDYSNAESRYRQALEVCCQLQGEQDSLTALIFNKLAKLYQAKGDYTHAEPLFQKALTITRTLQGEQGPETGIYFNNLAELYREIGDYTRAEPLFQRALIIMQNVQGGDQDLEIVAILNNLALLYQSIGKYEQAERLHQQALKICRTKLGDKHLKVATIIGSLAALYWKIGDYKLAEVFFQQTLAIYRQILGEQHVDIATWLNNLAGLYDEMGDLERAEILYQKALTIRCNILGKQHLLSVDCLNNLATVHLRKGNYEQAELLLQEALAISRQILGKQHPRIAGVINNLAWLYKDRGNLIRAQSLYEEALATHKQAFDTNQPDVTDTFSANILNNLATLLVITGRASEALARAQEAAAIYNSLINKIFSFASERQRIAYLLTLRYSFDAYLSLVSQHLATDSKAVRAALELVLGRKAIGAEALAAQRDAVIGGRYPHLKPRLQELTAMRWQIAQNTLAGPGKEDPVAHRRRLAEWTARKERLEVALARQIPEMNLSQRLAVADRQAVANALPQDTALVEFMRFYVFDFQAIPAKGENPWKPARYIAFVLPAGEPDQVQMIDLGEAVFIEQRIARFRTAITGESKHRRDLGAVSSVTVLRDDGEGIALRRAVFDPLLPALGSRRQILISPDGNLNTLPFEVLPTDDGQRLIDNNHLSYIAAGRDVLRFGIPPTAQLAAPLIVADPDFDLSGGSGVASKWSLKKLLFGAGKQKTSGREANGLSGHAASRCSRDINRAHPHFTPLPGTQLEGKNIAGMLKVQPWLQDTVLEAKLKAQRSPWILHFATHGFFLEDQKYDPEKSRWLRFTGSELSRLASPNLENPLLRSGLALAGVNTWLDGKSPPSEAEDGLLTAEDVSGLDLLDTDLVVLSACDTGMGDIQVGEGVLGLRRSFVLAGAKTLVMSLWEVPDKQTQELMEDFYRRLLKGQPRAEALRAAQLAMKARHPEPFYWGAFICQGDLGPLRQT